MDSQLLVYRYQGTLHSKEVCVRELQTDPSLWQPSRFWKKRKLFR